ncbi:LemA family protein [Lacticaseibacillus pabuli]|uniref:LemA family protein n=1 Tax=Lacticaseibacillus pabuli TaxID=3025672 RepID=A0ABY7WUJ3_9LACO|nr:LemA family protein [Lacticaseibacillus sp. KACC 23028]WDF83847.1 LemA family protein [Lacticaseibacillus sp. KACC 23028]
MNMKRLSNGAITGIVIGVVVIILAFWGIGTYNSLATANQNVDAKWSQVENVTQRRYDLIPNLVNAVKGSMKQEQTVFGNIANARKEYANANSTKDKANANAKLDQSVGTLISVIRESYPTLNSNKQVQTLMTQLEGSENRIAVERKRYNESVQSYNNNVVTFPKNIFANAMGMGKKPYFKADAKAAKVPKVDLDTGK